MQTPNKLQSILGFEPRWTHKVVKTTWSNGYCPVWVSNSGYIVHSRVAGPGVNKKQIQFSRMATNSWSCFWDCPSCQSSHVAASTSFWRRRVFQKKTSSKEQVSEQCSVHLSRFFSLLTWSAGCSLHVPPRAGKFEWFVKPKLHVTRPNENNVSFDLFLQVQMEDQLGFSTSGQQCTNTYTHTHAHHMHEYHCNTNVKITRLTTHSSREENTHNSCHKY